MLVLRAFILDQFFRMLSYEYSLFGSLRDKLVVAQHALKFLKLYRVLLDDESYLYNFVVLLTAPSSPVHNRRLLSARPLRMSSVELPDENEKSPTSASNSPTPSPLVYIQFCLQIAWILYATTQANSQLFDIRILPETSTVVAHKLIRCFI